MLCVLAYCAKDKAIAVRLAQWIKELGGVSNHDCLLGVHIDTDSSEIGDILRSAFRNVGQIAVDDTETVYPYIANMMWKRCATFIADWGEAQPWLWLEPDAVPLTPAWLDRIAEEYAACGKPFMLDKVVTPTSAHNSGVGVYPARVRDYTHQLWNLSNIPWDVFFKDDFTPHTHHTTLIHDKFYKVWDDPKSGAPEFPDAASLSIIESGAVLFHRNKSGNLIERLRESHGIPIPAPTPKSAECPDTAVYFNNPTLIEELFIRVAALEAKLSEAAGVVTSVPAKSGNGGLTAPPSLKPPRQRGKTKRDTRTPEQIQAAKDRMAKARAGRKMVAV